MVYTSDQGFFLGEHGWFDKRFMYEESIRMPLLVRYPREVTPGSSSDEDGGSTSTSRQPSAISQASLSRKRCRGTRWGPLLRGEHPVQWRASMYYRYWMHLDNLHRVGAHYGVRTRLHKLVHYPGEGIQTAGTDDQRREPAWELFDLEADPYELRSVYDHAAYADVVRELTDGLARLQRVYGDVPSTNAR